jgi:AAA domain
MQGQSMKRAYARQGHPCPVCGGESGCSVGEDGLFLCRRSKGSRPGFRHIGQAKADPSWSLYRSQEDPVRPSDRTAAAPPGHQDRAEEESPRKQSRRDWLAKAQEYAALLTPAKKQELAGELGLPLFPLDCLQFLGWKPRDRRGGCWVFPMQDGVGEITGLQRRWPGGEKMDDGGSTQGIFVICDWEERPGPVYIAEGVSDTLALAALGLAALGRHHNNSSHELLAEALSIHPEREVFVLGDLDYSYTSDNHPGRDGARDCAAALAKSLGRPIHWSLPPRGFKDVRSWCQGLSMLPATAETWHAQAERFDQGLHAHTSATDCPTSTVAELVSVPFSKVEPDVIEWLVPGWFPMGLPVLLAGEGGIGKSHVTLHMAARISKGECCFGLDYQPGEPRDVLVANCEDSSRKTMLPRLQAAGANMERVHQITGVTLPTGKPAPFSLAHLDQIAATLRQRPEIALVVIDPVSSYVAAAGLDDNSEIEVRKILDPLGDLAEESGALFLLMKHVRKSGGTKAVHMVIGSAAYSQRTRASYFVFEEPGSEVNKLLVCGKFNDAPKPQGRIFRLEAPPAGRVLEILRDLPDSWSAAKRAKYEPALVTTAWYGETDYSANDLAQASEQVEQDSGFDVDRAAQWLRKYLAQCPMRAQDVVEHGNTNLDAIHPAKWWRDRILKGRLGGSSQKGRAGPHDSWFYCLPGQNLDQPPAV